MPRDGDDGDVSESPGRSDKIVAVQEAMPATQDDSAMPRRSSVDAGDNIASATPASIPHAHPETSSRLEMGSSSSTAEAGIDETTAAMTSTPRAESVLRRYSGLGRGTWRSKEIAGSSSRAEAASDEAAAAMMNMPGADSALLRYSGLGRETSRSHEMSGSSSTAEAASDEAAAAMMTMPGADSALLRYSGLRRGLELGTVPIEMLNGADAATDRIIDIWTDDVSKAFDEIRTQVQSKENSWCLVGIDTEFCQLDGIVNPPVPPRSAEVHYQQTRSIVDGGDLVQVGIAMGDIEGCCQIVYQFNIQFDPSSRDKMSPNIAFLRDIANLDLNGHCARGIDPSVFFLHLSRSGLLKNTNICWVTYQGYADLGYLIRGLENISALPLDRRQFLLLVKRYFPRSIDLKIFHMKGICCDPPVRGIRGSGSFQSMASGLKVKRLGHAHGAGSDAHLTLLCYHAMVVSNPVAAFLLSEYRNTVYGVDEAIPRPPEDSQISYVDVGANNWNSQSKLITDMFNSSTCTAVGLAVNHQLTSKTPISYHEARVLIEGLPGPVKIGFALSDSFGRICFGRIWILNLQGTSRDPFHIRNDQFSTVVTQTSALFNHGILWCSSSSFAHMCMLKAVTTSRCLPTSLQESYQVHSAFFPNSRVVPLWSAEKREGHRSLETLRFFNPAMAMPAFSGFY